MIDDSVQRWSASDAAELYEVSRWGKGYFSVNSEGNLVVHPDRDPQRGVELPELIDRLELRGVDLPILFRFNGILKDRLREIHDTFARAISENDYDGKYICVYPIKVNQQRQVVEQVIECGREYGFGLEAGSKPEMLAVVAMADEANPIICNGFKDAEFIQMAMLAQKIGRTVIPVVEKFTELELILRIAAEVGVRPSIGIRVKLAARGAGRWQASGGFRSKFGLTISEVLRAVEHLEKLGMSDCLQLLHFHLGSQITNIRFIQSAVVEASRIYVDLAKRGANLKYLDVGGGLGVDYDGSQTNFESSVNYTLQEYADDVISQVKAVCDDAEIPHPNIITESGRAVAAYHSLLVFNVMGVSGFGVRQQELQLPEDAPQPLLALAETLEQITSRNLLESYHDAQMALEMAMTTFSVGHLPLEQRALAENLFWAICHRIRSFLKDVEFVPEELQSLDVMLADTYFCNFSLFQSIPDSWAIKQLFPVMPVHRLNECPANHAVLGDITCDSDGRIDRFIDRRDVRRTLLLHDYQGRPYYLAIFLVGAYQEILGDLHNLFGDTNAVHVDLNHNNDVVLRTIIKGETVSEVLDYVQFERSDLVNRLQTVVEDAVGKELLNHEEAGRFLKFYEAGLNSYTYLDVPQPSTHPGAALLAQQADGADGANGAAADAPADAERPVSWEAQSDAK